jgi:hypothetical protein
MRKFAVLAVCMIVAGLATAEYALGAIPGIPGSNGVITACADNGSGAMRAVASAGSCTASESAISWQARALRLKATDLTNGQTGILLNGRYGLTLSLACNVDSVVTGDVRAAVSAKSASPATLGGMIFFQDPTYTSGNVQIRPVNQTVGTSLAEITYLQARGTLGAGSVATTDTTLLFLNTANHQTMSITLHITANGSGHCGAYGIVTPT